jgi:hypothetical protein
MPLDLSCFQLSPDDLVALQNLQRATCDSIGDSATAYFTTGTDSLPRQTLARPAPVQPIDDVLDDLVAMSSMHVHRHSVGELDVVCPHCSARFFRGESLSCCARGSVDLPPWRPPPEPLLSLLQTENPWVQLRSFPGFLSF